MSGGLCSFRGGRSGVRRLFRCCRSRVGRFFRAGVNGSFRFFRRFFGFCFVGPFVNCLFGVADKLLSAVGNVAADLGDGGVFGYFAVIDSFGDQINDKDERNVENVFQYGSHGVSFLKEHYCFSNNQALQVFKTKI